MPNRPERGDVIIQLFQWPYAAVAEECSKLNQTRGIRAVQVTAPQEHRIIFRPLDDREVRRPWWERYQPVSFKLGKTRGGTLQEFKDMVTKCRISGIDVYAEVVLNHLAAVTSGTGRGSDGSWYSFDRDTFRYSQPLKDGTATELPDVLIPGKLVCNESLPLFPLGSLEESEDAYNRSYGCHPKLAYSTKNVPVVKLNLLNEVVKDEITGNLEELVKMGVNGFCIISATFSPAAELGEIIKNLKKRTNSSDIFVYVELMELEQKTLLRSYSEQDMHSFGLPFTLQISSSLSYGVNSTISSDESTEPNDLRSIFLALYASVFNENTGENYKLPITSFEHHEQLHSEPNSNDEKNINYNFIQKFPEIYKNSAYFFLLFNPPQYGIPRIISDYEVANGKESNGPPTSNSATFDILSPSSPSQWKNNHQKEFIKKLIAKRHEVYLKTPESLKDYDNLQTVLLTPTTTTSTTAETSNSNVLLYIFGFLNKPEQESEEGKNCTVTFALVASHVAGDQSSDEVFIKSETYQGTLLTGLSNLEVPEKEIFISVEEILSDSFSPIDNANQRLSVTTETTMDPDTEVTSSTFSVKIPPLSGKPQVIIFQQELPVADSDYCGMVSFERKLQFTNF